MDGVTLADALHNRGINIRYLGKIAGMLNRVTTTNKINSLLISNFSHNNNVKSQSGSTGTHESNKWEKVSLRIISAPQRWYQVLLN
jgi:hypothetical protein